MKRVFYLVSAILTLTAFVSVLGTAAVQAHDFPNDPDGHDHQPGTVATYGRCGTVLSGVDGAGIQTNPLTYDYALAAIANQGDAVDHQWVQDTGSAPIVFDMGGAVANVLFFPSIDHGPVPAEAFESTVYGGPTAAGPWTPANLAGVFDQGFDATWLSDDYVSLWTLVAPSPYIAVQWGGPRAELADGDVEVDAVCAATDIQPRSVEGVVFPGESFDVTKSVTTPAIAPNPDIFFLADTTGSMGPALANVQAGIGSIMATVVASQPTAQFGAGQYRDIGDAFEYNLDQSITANLAAVQAAVNTWSASGGGDTPEAQLQALRLVATDPLTGFRIGSSRIVVWFGDQPGHDPSGTTATTQAQAIAALSAAGIRVIAVDVGALDASGQATAITGATGGVLAAGVNPANLSAAILAGLGNLPVEVEMQSTCEDPISTTFTPNPQTITSGGTAIFTETISVAADAPGGIYRCRDVAFVNGQPLVDAAGQVISEVKVIKVPEGFLTGGGQINTGRGRNELKVSFGGNAGYLSDFSLVGHWNAVFHNTSDPDSDGGHFKSTELLALQFSQICGPGPNPPAANANAAHFTFEGEFNGTPGYRLEVRLTDYGEPGKDSDAIRMELHDPTNAVVYDTLISGDFPDNDDQTGCPAGASLTHQLDAGNLQIHSGVKD